MELDRFYDVIGHSLIVAPVDGVLYVSDRFWLTPFEGSNAQKLLKWWNLEAPGEFAVTHDDSPKVLADDLSEGHVGYFSEKFKTMLEAEQGCSLSLMKATKGQPLLVELANRELATVWTHLTVEREQSLIRRDYLDVVRASWEDRKAEARWVEDLRAIRIGDSIVVETL